MTAWILWGFLLLLQNASFTWVSRARNSSSVAYHALAAVCSNGVWFIGQLILVNKFMDARKSGNVPLLILTGAFYTALTVVGSVGMHSFLMKHVERGKRKIG